MEPALNTQPPIDSEVRRFADDNNMSLGRCASSGPWEDSHDWYNFYWETDEGPRRITVNWPTWVPLLITVTGIRGVYGARLDIKIDLTNNFAALRPALEQAKRYAEGVSG